MEIKSGALPVLFVHSGKQWYLKKTIQMAEAYNDTVILLGDESNRLFCKNWIAQDSLPQKRFLEFQKIYRHMSSNSYQFELSCFKRFYLIYEFLIQHDMTACVMLDSDLCSFIKYSDLEFMKQGFDAAYSIPETQEPLVWTGSPHMSFWTIKGLGAFLDFIERSYEGDMPELEEKFEYHRNNRKNGGICDMTLLYLWGKKEEVKIYNTAPKTKSGVFDHSLSVSSNYKKEEYQFDTKFGIKHIEWENGIPYFVDAETGEKVKALTIHAQGSSKPYIWAISKRKNWKLFRVFCNIYIWMRKMIKR